MWAPGADNSPDNSLNERWKHLRDRIDLRPCNGCSHCSIKCAEGVPMTRHEYDAVVRHIAQKVDHNLLSAVLAQDKRVGLGDGFEARMCRYLDMEAGGCTVYDARPLVCRLLGHVEWLPCPVGKIERPAPTEDALALMRAYSREERLTFEQWDERLAVNERE